MQKLEDLENFFPTTFVRSMIYCIQKDQWRCEWCVCSYSIKRAVYRTSSETPAPVVAAVVVVVIVLISIVGELAFFQVQTDTRGADLIQPEGHKTSPVGQ